MKQKYIPSDRELCELYGQQYDNVKHNPNFLAQLRQRFKEDFS